MKRSPALALLIAATLVAGCGDDDDGTDAQSAATDRTTTTVAPPLSTSTTTAPEQTTGATTATTTGPTTTLAGGGCPAPFDGNSTAVFDESRGTYAVFLRSVSGADRTLGFDVVQWLIGDAADAAYEAETGDDTGVPNGYYIVNENDLVRTAPVADDAVVRLLDLTGTSVAEAVEASFDDLVAGLPEFPFWLTFVDGTIVAVCEQYVP